MFLHVVDARFRGHHTVWLRFNNGNSGEIDLSKSLDGLVFEPLRNADFFQAFAIVGFTLTWPNGANFAPEYLFSLL